MVLQKLLLVLVQRAQLVEKLAESRAIRRAAQLTAWALTRGQQAGRHASERALRHVRHEATKVPQSVSRLRNTFIQELKEGMRRARSQIKDGK